MKKIITLLLICFIAITICGCSSQNEISNSSKNNTEIEHDTNEYMYTATLELFPDIMISAKSREALDEVLDILLDSGIGIDINSNNSTNSNSDKNNNTVTSNSQSDTTTNQNESIELNETEKSIFNLLKQTIDTFPNPSSVKVVKFHAYQSSEERYYLTLTSENNFGGNLTDIYTLDSDGAYGSTYSETQLDKMSTMLGLTKPSCDISKINKALERYYSEQGW